MSDSDIEKIWTEIRALAVQIGRLQEMTMGMNAEIGKVHNKLDGAAYDYVTKEFCTSQHVGMQRSVASLVESDKELAHDFERKNALYWAALVILGRGAFGNLVLNIIAMRK